MNWLDQSSNRRRHARRGSVLVEFALVSLAFYLLLAAILTFGFMLYAAQGTQQVVDFTAREISRWPFPANDTYTLEYVLFDGNANDDSNLADFRDQVFDEHYLVLDITGLDTDALNALVGSLPAVNRQLVPLMISDTIDERRVMRFPGAVYDDPDPSNNPSEPPPSGWLVWPPIFEEIENLDDPTTGNPFLITSSHRGLVALRLNYPYQSAVMSGFQPNPDGPFEPTLGQPIPADDSAPPPPDGAPPGTPVSSDAPFGTYTGPYSRGKQAAMGMEVRPFTRAIASQAIYRREVFGAP